MAVTQKPPNLLILGEKSRHLSWKQIPTWYQVSEDDHMISPATGNLFVKQLNSTTISLASIHASLVSHPNEVAQLILNATKEVSK